MKVLLLTWPMPASLYGTVLLEALPDVTVIEHTPDMPASELADVDAVLAWRFPDGVVPRMSALKWVCAVSAGVEKLLVPELPDHVPVSRIVDREQSYGIAQYTVTMALRHARQIPLYEQQALDRDWTRHPVTAVRSIVAVLGVGEMGGAIATMLEAVGFEVRRWSRSVGGPLDDLLAAAEIVVCALPLTSETGNLFDAGRFARMRRGAYLINIARGGHVVEADLIEAVKSGQLSGAALDVQCNEPMRADDPLWGVDGITITPHIAAMASPVTAAQQFVEGLRELQRGGTPANVVDKIRGY